MNNIKRQKWIDCAKLVAIIAVIVDHCYGFLYNNSQMAMASYFSVSVFVMLSGVTSYMSNQRSETNAIWMLTIKRILSVFLPYVLATAIYQIVLTKYFDVTVFFNNVIAFNATPPFYFILFFLQLIAINPFLYSLLRFGNNHKYSNVWQFGIICILCVLSAVSINYTYILPVHGGGQFLFGGTYIVLYYLGMLFYDKHMFFVNKKCKILLLCSSSIAWIIWWQLLCRELLPFDVMVQKYWGAGGNPSSINFIVFAIITFFLLYSLFSLLEESCNKIAAKLICIISFVGQNTLYIFLYHLLVLTYLCNFAMLTQNIWIRRIVFFSAMILIPIAICYLVTYIKNKTRDLLLNYYTNAHLK